MAPCESSGSPTNPRAPRVSKHPMSQHLHHSTYIVLRPQHLHSINTTAPTHLLHHSTPAALRLRHLRSCYITTPTPHQDHCTYNAARYAPLANVEFIAFGHSDNRGLVWGFSSSSSSSTVVRSSKFGGHLLQMHQGWQSPLSTPEDLTLPG